MEFNVIFVFLCPRVAFEVVIPIAKMTKALDPFWQYGEPEDGTNRKNLCCKFVGITCREGIRGNLGSKMGLIRKRAKISFCELEFKNQ